jgi:hypothetical protein
VPLPQLRRVRWAIRATLSLGVAASVAANILHAEPNPISQVIAAWPPLALLVTVELISRVPVHRRVLAAVRVVATSGIAGIAAWVSYWHMAGVAARYGERGPTPYLLPLSVDGLVIVASVSLVELAGRIRDAERTGAAGPTRAPEPVPAPTPAKTGAPAPIHAMTEAPAPTPATIEAPADGATRVAEPTAPDSSAPRTTQSQPRRTRPTRHEDTKPTRHEAPPATRPRRPVAETVALAARIEAEQPDVTPDELAAQLGITTKRLRAIQREVAAPVG